MDPLAFRLHNLPEGDGNRDRLPARFSRRQTGSAGRRAKYRAGARLRHLLRHREGGLLATCAEVAVEPGSGKVRVVRVVEAFECGAVVNPDGLSSQVEGAVMQALGGALFEQIKFADGRTTLPPLALPRAPLQRRPPNRSSACRPQRIPSAVRGSPQ